jgi:hypothetical protein
MSDMPYWYILLGNVIWSEIYWGRDVGSLVGQEFEAQTRVFKKIT